MIVISFSDSIKQHMKCYMKRSLFSSSSYVVFIHMCIYYLRQVRKEMAIILGSFLKELAQFQSN